MRLYVHRHRRTDCYGRGAQDGHLDFHTAPELLQMLFYVHRDGVDYKAGRGAQDGLMLLASEDIKQKQNERTGRPGGRG